MDNTYEFDFSKLNPEEQTDASFLHQIEALLETSTLPFTSVITHNGKKFVIGKTKGNRVSIEPLSENSSFLASRATYINLQRNFLTRIRGLNHNIRGPLSGIRSRVELLTRQLSKVTEPTPQNIQNIPNENLQFTLNKILNSADALQKQLTDFEQIFSWLDPEQEVKLILPGQVLETIRDFLITDLFVKRNIQILLSLRPPLRTVMIHPAVFVEPILQIIDNAVESIRPQGEGKIAISVTSSGSDCIVEIQNNGPQVDDRLFETALFDPGNGTFSNGPGMGLSFSKWLIEMAGGEITLLKNQKSDVVFYLRYPRRP